MSPANHKNHHTRRKPLSLESSLQAAAVCSLLDLPSAQCTRKAIRPINRSGAKNLSSFVISCIGKLAFTGTFHVEIRIAVHNNG